MKLINKIKSAVKTTCWKLYYNVTIPYYRSKHSELVEDIKERGRANVVFFASSLAMWRYQGIFEKLSADIRFNVTIVIVPFKSYTEEQQIDNVKKLRDYFDERAVSYIDFTKCEEAAKDIIDKLSPDILFYPQPYDGAYGNEFDCQNFRDKLICYCPYALLVVTYAWNYNNSLQNFAWRLFYASDLHRKESVKFSSIKDRNVVVTGDPNADKYHAETHKQVWKPQNKEKTRIIWAPHFTINDGQLLSRGSFLWMAEFMLNYAKENQDSIQFALKPHPRLITELYKNKEWGKMRTDDYFKEWQSLPNCQLETGDFTDLFMTSDAMIHDSGSFTAEYLFTHNPVLFTSKNTELTRSQLSEFGRLAFNCHYQADSIERIKAFIKDEVINHNDPMLDQRNDFYFNHLVSSGNESVADKMYKSILDGLSFRH